MKCPLVSWVKTNQKVRGMIINLMFFSVCVREGMGGGRGGAGEGGGEKTDNSLVQGIRKKTKPNQTIIRVFPEFIW